MEAASKEALAHEADYIWLDLMAHADWAREAYERLGFRVTGTSELEGAVKADRRGKLVMERDLG